MENAQNSRVHEDRKEVSSCHVKGEMCRTGCLSQLVCPVAKAPTTMAMSVSEHPGARPSSNSEMQTPGGSSSRSWVLSRTQETCMESQAATVGLRRASQRMAALSLLPGDTHISYYDTCLESGPSTSDPVSFCSWGGTR